MSEHIDTRRKLKEIPLISDFESILNLCTLSDEDKEILRLHYIKQKDFRYIGDTLGFSEKTVKVATEKPYAKFHTHFDRPSGRFFHAFQRAI